MSLRPLITATTTVKSVLSTKMHLITPSSRIYNVATEAETGFVDGPFWGFVWPGSYGLAKYIQEKPGVVSDKRVLDFASGCGLSGFASLGCGARHVVFNDIDEASVEVIRMNAEVNETREEVYSTVSENLIHQPVEDIDVIIAGDVCYEEDLAREVTSWLSSRAATQTVLIGDPGRWSSKEHLEGAEGNNIEKVAEYELPRWLREDNHGMTSTSVWEVMRR